MIELEVIAYQTRNNGKLNSWKKVINTFNRYEEKHFHIYVDKKEKIEKKSIEHGLSCLTDSKNEFTQVCTMGETFLSLFIPSMVQQWYFVLKIVLTYCEKFVLV